LRINIPTTNAGRGVSQHSGQRRVVMAVVDLPTLRKAPAVVRYIEQVKASG